MQPLKTPYLAVRSIEFTQKISASVAALKTLFKLEDSRANTGPLLFCQ